MCVNVQSLKVLIAGQRMLSWLSITQQCGVLYFYIRLNSLTCSLAIFQPINTPFSVLIILKGVTSVLAGIFYLVYWCAVNPLKIDILHRENTAVSGSGIVTI